MKSRPVLMLPIAFVLSVAIPRVAAGQPPAPSLLSPAGGASVQEPFTISWSTVTDPNGIVAYNWQISPSSTFSPVVRQNSTTSPTTRDTVSGLANGTYFWRAQAVNAVQSGPWSQPRSFTVTGVGPGAPGTPTLGPPKGYSTFHPYEAMTFTWSAVPGAATYTLEASTDPSFPVCCSTIKFDNISNPTMTFAIGNPEGNYSARVFAVNASGVFSAPSNLTTFSVFFNNPLPPPPSTLAPPNGATLTLPITITWTDVPNPQVSGYNLEIATDSGFRNIEDLDSQLTDPTRTVTSLTPGQKFWRVDSVQGSSSPTLPAVTAWSATGTFTVSSAPPKPVSIQVTTDPLNSGDTTFVQLQLTGAPPTPATISLTSSNPSAAPVPATITMPANLAWTQFQMQAGQVASATPVTITATLNGASATGHFTVAPTALKSLSISPSPINGGAQPGGIVMLTGQAPPGGAAVALSSNSPAVTPPPSVFVNPGDFSVSFPIQTNTVTANTNATVTASWNGTTTQAQVTLTPQPAPASITLNPTSTVGMSGSSFATVTIASAQSTDTILQVASSQPTIAQVPNSVTVPAGITNGGFNIFTQPVTTQTLVTISVSGGGVTKSAVLTVNPSGTPPAASLSSFTVSPTSVTGGNPSTGTVTLSNPAPTGGIVVNLGSNQPGAASVPASVTVGAGATSANFTVTTFPSAGTTVQLSASVPNQTLFAALSVNPPPASASLSSVTVNPTSVVGGTSSTGSVTLSAAAPNGGAVVSLASSNTAAATVPASVTVPAGATSATFTVTTSAVTASTSSTISATFGGATRSVVLTVTPPPPPPPAASLSAVSVTPTSVTGGTAAQGTVTLTSAAPAGGFTVSLSSSGAAATVPPSVTVAQGATSVTFGITTTSVTAATSVTITASAGTLTRTATLTVNPPGQGTTLTVTATGRGGETISSNPAGISVAVGSTGSAPFATGTLITLSDSNGRDVIWSGACSSSGNKAKSCTFTLTGAASVTANVQ